MKSRSLYDCWIKLHFSKLTTIRPCKHCQFYNAQIVYTAILNKQRDTYTNYNAVMKTYIHRCHTKKKRCLFKLSSQNSLMPQLNDNIWQVCTCFIHIHFDNLCELKFVHSGLPFSLSLLCEIIIQYLRLPLTLSMLGICMVNCYSIKHSDSEQAYK